MAAGHVGHCGGEGAGISSPGAGSWGFLRGLQRVGHALGWPCSIPMFLLNVEPIGCVWQRLTQLSVTTGPKKSCFHHPFLTHPLARSHLHLVPLSPEMGQLSTFLHLPALSP